MNDWGSQVSDLGVTGKGGRDSRVGSRPCRTSSCTIRSVPDPPVRAGDEKHTSSADKVGLGPRLARTNW